jgi:hypothetical protein
MLETRASVRDFPRRCAALALRADATAFGVLVSGSAHRWEEAVADLCGSLCHGR